jgi:hypothetical protein
MVHSDHSPDPAAYTWFRLDSLLNAALPGALGECAVTAHVAGARLDVNSASDLLLSRVLDHAGLRAETADSIIAALADWRDADDVPRAAGAERGWYEARGLLPPPNRPLVDVREIAFVRGVTAAGIEDLLDVEPGPISISHAAAPILAALPGFSREAVERAHALRRSQGLHTFQDIADGLPPSLAVAFTDALPELASLVFLEPGAWIVRAEASAGLPAVHVLVEVRLVRSGSTVRAARWRMWLR